MQILANKQWIFDAFADRSVAAQKVDQTFSRETMDQIVRDELRKYASARWGGGLLASQRAQCLSPTPAPV
jgi:hypothetical protein